MNLSKLFDAQKVLDARIEAEHPPIEGEDRLAKKILALQVELSELANEWRGFKFWSLDREPRTRVPRELNSDDPTEQIGELANLLLEEYVDCLHFILSIGLSTYRYCETNIQINHEIYGEIEPVKYENVTKQLNKLFYQVGYFEDCIYDNEFGCLDEVAGKYKWVFQLLLGLGEMLGFTDDQIEQAYFEKNAINLRRQDDGY